MVPEAVHPQAPLRTAMIRFSKMADYGVLLLVHFAHNEGKLTSSSTLAKLYHMPRSVVANLLKEFTRAELLESQRGLHGGYKLARAAEQISLLEILNVIDGPVQLIDCAADDLRTVGERCEYEDVCPSRSPMVGVHRRIVSFLEELSLSELMNDESLSSVSG